ncbi:MAG: hypothetical protein AABY36_00330, partial [Campylobacterota bacterium]|mgnify:CR=1
MKKIRFISLVTFAFLLIGCGGAIPFPAPEHVYYNKVILEDNLNGTVNLIGVSAKKGASGDLMLREGCNVFCNVKSSAEVCVIDNDNDQSFDHIIWKHYRDQNNKMDKLDNPVRYKVVYEFEEAIKKARANGMPILITAKGETRPNSAGGVDTYINFVNISNKNIKYVDVGFIPFNGVNEKVSSSIGNQSLKLLRFTGPLEQDKHSRAYWKNVWYNNSIKCSHIVSVKVIYMDDSNQIIDESEIKNLMYRPIENSCKI